MCEMKVAAMTRGQAACLSVRKEKELRLQYWDILLNINPVKHTQRGDIVNCSSAAGLCRCTVSGRKFYS